MLSNKIQDPAATAALNELHSFLTSMPYPLAYHVCRRNEWIRVYDRGLLEDGDLWQWMQVRGALAIAAPDRNPFDEVLVWFPNQASRHYADITAEAYLTQPLVYNRQPELLTYA